MKEIKLNKDDLINTCKKNKCYYKLKKDNLNNLSYNYNLAISIILLKYYKLKVKKGNNVQENTLLKNTLLSCLNNNVNKKQPINFNRLKNYNSNIITIVNTDINNCYKVYFKNLDKLNNLDFKDKFNSLLKLCYKELNKNYYNLKNNSFTYVINNPYAIKVIKNIYVKYSYSFNKKTITKLLNSYSYTVTQINYLIKKVNNSFDVELLEKIKKEYSVKVLNVTECSLDNNTDVGYVPTLKNRQVVKKLLSEIKSLLSEKDYKIWYYTKFMGYTQIKVAHALNINKSSVSRKLRTIDKRLQPLKTEKNKKMLIEGIYNANKGYILISKE